MSLHFSAFHRWLGLGLAAVAVPALVLACSADVAPITGGDTQPTSTATTDPEPTPTSTGTSTAKPVADDAGVDAAKDSGPPATDVVGSAECTAYCAKMKGECDSTCIPKQDCAIDKGRCAASTQAYLDCQTTQGSWYCGSDGFSIVSDCKYDSSLCE